MENLKKIIQYFIVIALALSVSTAIQAKKMDNLAVMIPSCDKYAEVWHPFFNLLFKYWPGLDQPIYLISNQKTYANTRVQSVLIPNEKSWSDNILVALEKTKEDYVLILMDDYLLTKKVDEEKIEQYFEIMKKEKAACIQLYNISAQKISSVSPEMKELGYLAQDAQYRTSLQAGIWDKAVLKELLLSGENPWQFELLGTIRSQKIERPFMGIVEGASPISYIGAIWKGYWDPAAIAFLEAENIKADIQMPVCGKMRYFIMGPVRTFISVHITQPIKSYFGIVNILPVDI